MSLHSQEIEVPFLDKVEVEPDSFLLIPIGVYFASSWFFDNTYTIFI